MGVDGVGGRQRNLQPGAGSSITINHAGLIDGAGQSSNPADGGSREAIFNYLPPAIIPHIFPHLSGEDAAKYSCVSKDWKESGKRERQKRINAFPTAINEDKRSVEEIMGKLTPEQQKCLKALKSVPPNDIGHAIQMLKPEINKQTESAKIDDILRNAVITNKIDNALLALIFGADVDEFDYSGETALYKAAYDGHKDIVKVLIGAGADVNKADSCGATALFGAAISGDTEIVKALLEAGAPADQVDSDGITPLSSAAIYGHTEIVEALLEAGADVNKADIDGNTPLHWAAFSGHTETVKALLGAEADINKTNLAEEDTPLYLAVYDGHTETVETLLEAGADVNKANSSGLTPLFRAIFRGDTKIVKALLEKGATVDQVNSAGNTPLYLAALNGHTEIVGMLKKAAED